MKYFEESLATELGRVYNKRNNHKNINKFNQEKQSPKNIFWGVGDGVRGELKESRITYVEKQKVYFYLWLAFKMKFQ